MSLHPLWSNFPEMVPELQKVSELLKYTVDESPASLREDLGRLVLSPGKMLRPAFVILSAAWGPEKTSGIYSVAAAVELLHLATLVHDDVLDAAPQRRGVKTLHQTMGIKKAVLAGDYLLSEALRLASCEYEKDLLPVLMRGVNRLCVSEIDQDFHSFEMRISRDAYLSRIRGKTAELFGISCYAGAAVSHCEKEIKDSLYELGILFGMAFQIEDDILDYTGTPGCLGKRTGKDLKAGIPTLPLIEALDDGDTLIRRFISSPLLRLWPALIQKRIVEKGYTARADIAAGDYKLQAADLLKVLPDSSFSHIFKNLFSQLQYRNN